MKDCYANFKHNQYFKTVLMKQIKFKPNQKEQSWKTAFQDTFKFICNHKIFVLFLSLYIEHQTLAYSRSSLNFSTRYSRPIIVCLICGVDWFKTSRLRLTRPQYLLEYFEYLWTDKQQNLLGKAISCMLKIHGRYCITHLGLQSVSSSRLFILIQIRIPCMNH